MSVESCINFPAIPTKVSRDAQRSASLPIQAARAYAADIPSLQLEAKLNLGRALLELHSKKPNPAYLDRARRIILEVVVEDFTHPGATKLRAMLASILAQESPKTST